jgi:hypothetical protein
MKKQARKRKPQKLTLGGHTLILKWEDLSRGYPDGVGDDECDEDDGEFALRGYYDSSTFSVSLDESLSEEMQHTVLIHEVLHAIDDVYGLNLEHTAVHSLAIALHQVLKPYLKKM